MFFSEADYVYVPKLWYSTVKERFQECSVTKGDLKVFQHYGFSIICKLISLQIFCFKKLQIIYKLDKAKKRKAQNTKLQFRAQAVRKSKGSFSLSLIKCLYKKKEEKMAIYSFIYFF